MRTRRMTGRVAGALAVLAALSGLTACGPASKPVVALNYAGGRPTAVIVGCSGFKIDNVYVADNTTVNSKARWSAESAQSPVDAAPAQITLLVAPPGWTVTDGTLTAFDPANKYEISAFANRADPATTVGFTVALLKALPPGQVLVSKGNTESVAVSEKKFRADAADAC